MEADRLGIHPILLILVRVSTFVFYRRLLHILLSCNFLSIGFYFVRNNPKTVYFFEMLLRHGDYITKVKSHQAGLTSVMNEHVSWKGLRVKTFPRGPNTLFPGGGEYHTSGGPALLGTGT